MSGLPGHQPHELSALAETSSYYTSLNDLKGERQMYAPIASRPFKQDPGLTKLLNSPPPGKSKQTKKYDGE